MTSKIVSINPLIIPVENCFEEMKVQLSLQLPPMDTQNLCSGTKSMLDRLIFKYKTELGGIIISYYDVVHTDKEAKIFYDSPYLGMNIHVKFLVFKPFRDQILNGVVKRVSTTHISLLVFGTISASISKSNIPRSFIFDHSSNMFINKQNSTTISVGTKIAFKVIDVSADKHNIGIQGDMTDITSTGIIGFDENQSLQFGSQYDAPNKYGNTDDNNINNYNGNNSNNKKNSSNNSNNGSLINNINNDLSEVVDESEKESEEEPKPIIIKEEPKIVSVKIESKKVVVKEEKQKSTSSKKDKDSKKEKDSKKRKKDSSEDSESSEEDKKKKSSKKEKESSKKSKKVKVESSSNESSEDEKEKKKKKKK
ncbi:hypothetical protein RB653_007488 [Dictyostelium firmibasis]|uniref:DNA-directed RNA polymerase I subunit RPA43 n=1 Tax=Dictyostelium firmibasis TaxID=79012 RepID=A0AAN7TLW4_9MYCE